MVCGLKKEKKSVVFVCWDDIKNAKLWKFTSKKVRSSLNWRYQRRAKLKNWYLAPLTKFKEIRLFLISSNSFKEVDPHNPSSCHPLWPMSLTSVEVSVCICCLYWDGIQPASQTRPTPGPSPGSSTGFRWSWDVPSRTCGRFCLSCCCSALFNQHASCRVSTRLLCGGKAN